MLLFANLLEYSAAGIILIDCVAQKLLTMERHGPIGKLGF